MTNRKMKLKNGEKMIVVEVFSVVMGILFLTIFPAFGIYIHRFGKRR